MFFKQNVINIQNKFSKKWRNNYVSYIWTATGNNGITACIQISNGIYFRAILFCEKKENHEIKTGSNFRIFRWFLDLILSLIRIPVRDRERFCRILKLASPKKDKSNDEEIAVKMTRYYMALSLGDSYNLVSRIHRYSQPH